MSTDQPNAKKVLSEENKRIEWQLKCLSMEARRLSTNDIDWAIKMENAYKERGWLSKREQEILDNLYTRYA